MSPEPVQRNLTTIFAADVEGYTRRMRAVEATAPPARVHWRD
jgi:class 3 adenylate cyclase